MNNVNVYLSGRGINCFASMSLQLELVSDAFATTLNSESTDIPNSASGERHLFWCACDRWFVGSHKKLKEYDMIDIEKDKSPELPSNRRCVCPIASASAYRFRSALVAGRHVQNRRQEFVEEQ